MLGEAGGEPVAEDQQSPRTPASAADAVNKGYAFVFVFPFGIETGAGAAVPVVVASSGITCRIYWPHANGAALDNSRPLDCRAIPSPPGTQGPPKILPFTLQRVPHPADSYVLATALRVDVYGTLERRELRKRAELTVGRFLRLIRLWSRQWWIGRGFDETDGLLRISFEVDGAGLPKALEGATEARIGPRLKTELRLTEEIFRYVGGAMHVGADAPFSATALLDSVYFASISERQRAIYDAATACEGLLREQAIQKGKVTKSSIQKAITDKPLSNLDIATRKLFGRSFYDDHPDAKHGVERLRLARNALAHGDGQEILACPELQDQKAFWVAHRAVFDLFQWVARVQPRSFPDPMLAFIREMVPAHERD